MRVNLQKYSVAVLLCICCCSPSRSPKVIVPNGWTLHRLGSCCQTYTPVGTAVIAVRNTIDDEEFQVIGAGFYAQLSYGSTVGPIMAHSESSKTFMTKILIDGRHGLSMSSVRITGDERFRYAARIQVRERVNKGSGAFIDVASLMIDARCISAQGCQLARKIVGLLSFSDSA